MTFMNNSANIKQFELIKYIYENSSDEHVISKITIVLRRDKIEAPYYMITKIRLTACVDNPDSGIIHAMDVLNHNRMYNLTENTYNEIKSLITDSHQAEISKNDKELKIVLTSRNDDEFRNMFKDCRELFDKIDSLVD